MNPPPDSPHPPSPRPSAQPVGRPDDRTPRRPPRPEKRGYGCLLPTVLVLLLASPASSFITGSAFVIDGGALAQ